MKKNVRDKKERTDNTEPREITSSTKKISRQNKELLNTERDNFRNSMETLPFGVQILSTASEFMYINPTMLNMWGYQTIEQLKAVRLEKAFTPESVALMRRIYKERLTGKIPYVHELTMICKNGQLRDVRVYPQEIVWNKQACYQLIYEDVTERKKMVKDLRFSNAAFSSIHEAIFIMDADFTITHWNSISEKIFGIRSSDAIGKSIGQLMQMVEEHPGQNQQRMIDLITKRYNHEEQIYRTPKGDIWVDVHTQAVENEEKIIGWVTLAMDISNRKKNEETLRESEERYRTLVAASPNGIIQTSLDGMIIYASPKMRKLVGYEDPDAAFGHSPLEWIMPEDRARAANNIKRILTGELLGANYYRVLRKDQTYFWGEINSSILRNNEGTPIGMMSVFSDITERKKAEEELTRRALLLDATNDGILLSDMEGNIIFANEAICRAFGTKREQMLHITTMDQTLVSSENFHTMNEQILQHGSLTFEIVRHDPQGLTRYVEIRAQIVRIEDKDLVMTISRDITEHKKSEEELRDRERRFRELAESITDVFYAMDRDFRFTYWNHASELTSGIKSEDALGKHYFDVVSDTDARRQTFEIFKSVMETGIPRYFTMKFPGEKPVVHEISAYPTREGISVFSRDITEKEEINNRLKQSEERLRIVFEDAPDAYCLYDMKGKIIDANRTSETMTGYSRQDVLGKTLIEMKMLPYEDDIAKAMEMLKKNANGHATGPDELHLVRRDGKVIDIEVTSFPTHIGEQVLVLAIIRDITERKKMQENLMITDRLASIGELAAGMAHELNNPLTSILGLGDLVLNENIPDNVREDINNISNEARRMAVVTKNMLAFSRKHPSVKTRLNINDVLSKVLEVRTYEYRTNNIQVINRLADDLPEIMGDNYQLQQVFLNIIINAEYFMKEAHNGGTLTVISRQHGSNIQISIIDDGPGISKENLNHLFNPFFTTKPVGKGTGLGLSICYGIITEHNGHIYVESELGKGTEFIIELPVAE